MTEHESISLENDENDISSTEDDSPPSIIKPKVSIEVSSHVKKHKSKYKGVFSCGKKFKAQIQTNGVQHYLGLFDTEEQAARAYDAHARAVLGPKCKPNFQDDEPPILEQCPPPFDDEPVIQEEAVKLKSSTHSRRTYVGIKAQRARLQESTISPDASTAMYNSFAYNQSDAMRLNMSLGMNSGNAMMVYPPKKKQKGEDSELHGAHLFGHMSAQPGGMQAHMHVQSPFHSHMQVHGQHQQQQIHAHQQQQQLHQQQQHQQQLFQQQQRLFQQQQQLQLQHQQQQQQQLVEVPGDVDWRDQIYYWCGELSVDGMKGCLLWRGSWLGSLTGKPEPEEFVLSNNEFEYRGPSVDHGQPSPAACLSPVSGLFTGFYMMDSDGLGNFEKYLDKEFVVDFEVIKNSNPVRFAVTGRGESDFGSFVLSGSYNSLTRVLEMSRQYVAETDERATMTIAQLKQLRYAAAAAAAAARTGYPMHMQQHQHQHQQLQQRGVSAHMVPAMQQLQTSGLHGGMGFNDANTMLGMGGGSGGGGGLDMQGGGGMNYNGESSSNFSHDFSPHQMQNFLPNVLNSNTFYPLAPQHAFTSFPTSGMQMGDKAATEDESCLS